MSAIELHARPSADFDAKLAQTIEVLQQAALEHAPLTAPAPTEVKVTSVPMTAPNSRGRLQCRGVAARRSWPRATAAGAALPRSALYKVAAAVSSRAAPKVLVIRLWACALAVPTRLRMKRVISEAGMLPAERCSTTRQSTTRARASLTEPPILVKAANSRSVPTAR